MKHFSLLLKDEFTAIDTEYEPRLVAYIPDNSHEIEENRRRSAILICPGGAYIGCSEREAEPIALDYVARGFAAFVLFYSCRPMTYPRALREVAASLALIRRRAAEWTVDPNCIAVGGFSAGGHLAASLGCKWQCDELYEGLNLSADERRPDAMVLCYPVMAGDPTDGEQISIRSVSGMENPTSEVLREHDLPAHVTELTPPAFLWHTENDPLVPVTGTLRFATQMHYHGVGFELHVFPSGAHGLANCNTTTAAKSNTSMISDRCAEWVEMSIRRLLERFADSSL